jgi:inhibitor of KinA sporulation pathway (predicted exonuclease)
MPNVRERRVLQMRIMSLDCEYTQPSKKTIQIGAAAYHLPTGELLGEFETFVDPREIVSDYITKLTGIRTSDVTGAPTIREAYEDLRIFHKKHKCFMNPLVYGNGIQNDSQHIYSEAYPDKISQEQFSNFMGFRVIDVKGIYQSIQIYNNKTVKGSLKDSCDKVGIGFEGQEHTALVDAKNAFRLWFYLIKKFPGGFK